MNLPCLSSAGRRCLVPAPGAAVSARCLYWQSFLDSGALLIVRIRVTGWLFPSRAFTASSTTPVLAHPGADSCRALPALQPILPAFPLLADAVL